MRILFLFGALAILVSCHTVRFVNPQPLNGERLRSFPVELHGIWRLQDEGTIEFREDVVIATEFHRDSLGTVRDTTYEYTYLNDSIQLYRADDYLVFNELKTNGYWRIMAVRQEKKGAIGLYFCDEYSIYGKFKGLTIDSASLLYDQYVAEIDDLVSVDTMLVHPTLKSLKKDRKDQVSYVVMNGQMHPKDLKKICREEFLYMRLMQDGTIYIPKLELDEED